MLVCMHLYGIQLLVSEANFEEWETKTRWKMASITRRFLLKGLVGPLQYYSVFLRLLQAPGTYMPPVLALAVPNTSKYSQCWVDGQRSFVYPYIQYSSVQARTMIAESTTSYRITI